ncbi:hypothetical protein CEXT_465341 [Caerostris extrusa]|uniref:Uncharacterized protein n=1 Tax=Caerostris extrusa TaxID=172846 RepID=A0AAV4PCZ6_CAEEX|nr:hypothetical protein CEXT_465341 [Caerostris extrusa]
MSLLPRLFSSAPGLPSTFQIALPALLLLYTFRQLSDFKHHYGTDFVSLNSCLQSSTHVIYLCMSTESVTPRKYSYKFMKKNQSVLNSVLCTDTGSSDLLSVHIISSNRVEVMNVTHNICMYQTGIVFKNQDPETC